MNAARVISLLAAACLVTGVTAACSSGTEGGGTSSTSAAAPNTSTAAPGGSNTPDSSASAAPSGSGGLSTVTSAVGTEGDISVGVEPDAKAVALLPDSIKQKGTIVVAMDLKYPPTSFMSPDNKPMGYNVDIARLLAAKLGLKLQIEDVSFSTIIPGLTGGRYDFTTTNMSATAARLKVLDMIDYWADGSSLGVKAGNPENLDINNDSICGKAIAVTLGSTQQETYLPALSKKCTDEGKPEVQIVTLPDVNTALTQLASNRIVGIFYDTPSLAYAVQQQGSQFALTATQYQKPASQGNDLVAIGLAKGSPLTKAMQAAMQSIIDSPLYMKALNNWGLGAGAIKTADIATGS